MPSIFLISPLALPHSSSYPDHQLPTRHNSTIYVVIPTPLFTLHLGFCAPSNVLLLLCLFLGADFSRAFTDDLMRFCLFGYVHDFVCIFLISAHHRHCQVLLIHYMITAFPSVTCLSQYDGRGLYSFSCKGSCFF